MGLEFIMGGMPRGGTTVAAKFMSLNQDMFCYAGETHLIPLVHSMFGQMPCRNDKVIMVARFLSQQFMTAMVEMPRFSVSQGAHPGNLIFDEKNVADLVDAVCSFLYQQLYGAELYRSTLKTLCEVLSKSDERPILGEKTPNNVFAMADYIGETATKNIVIMREPIGVLRSMKARIDKGDIYSSAFKGNLETNIGMYLEYATAARTILKSSDNLLVRYEDMATDPASVLERMFELFGYKPEQRVINFVENGGDPEIANRAPMNYKRLNITTNYSALSPVDIWKVFNLTRDIRETFGYSDAALTELGFDVPKEWPDVEVPSKVLPLYGFHETGRFNNPWMKRKAGLVVYLGKGRLHDITLEFKSKFPEQVPEEVELYVSINGVQREVIKVNNGSQLTVVNVKIHSDELVPMGNQSGYAIIDLESSIAYSLIGHTEKGEDAREISFQLKSWKINKKNFKWW